MAGKNNARITDVATLKAAGINPKTGLPVKFDQTVGSISSQEALHVMAIFDEQDAINAGTWYNLPKSLDGRLIERIAYYRGQGILFVLEDCPYFLPYALSGSIDVYGRFKKVTPLPFNGVAKTADDAWITGLEFIPVYDVVDEDGGGLPELKGARDYCVILNDYSPQISQKIVSREILNQPLVKFEAECLPFMRTALVNSTGVRGIRVHDADEASNVTAASISINAAAASGEKYVPIVGDIAFQDLTDGSTAKAEEFLLAMQSLDNLRLATHGLESGGIFQKRAHVLQDEADMNASSSSLTLKDRVKNRQDFCNIVNSIWGWGIWYEPNEIESDGAAVGEDQLDYTEDPKTEEVDVNVDDDG